MTDTIAAEIVVQSLSGLIWHEWENGCAVFNRLTGETHMLDLTSSYLLRLIEADPRPTNALTRQMIDDLQWPQDDASARRVARLVQNFVVMGVIEPVP